MQNVNQQNTISDDRAKTLGIPLADSNVMTPEDRQFMEMLMNKVRNNEINLFVPSSLINQDVYNKLKPEDKAKADADAFNFLAAIREIKGLYDANMIETYQMQNIVHRLRVTKERVEALGGDIFII